MADAFGQMLLGGTGLEIIERDDGFLDAVKMVYFAPVAEWPAVERRALRWVRGRVLDAGVGAGRAALELQRRGRSVVGIDISPGAVEVARARGVRDVRLLAFEDLDDSVGQFDTIVMFGNNFGLFGSPSKAKRLLRRLRPLADRIVAGSNDPLATVLVRICAGGACVDHVRESRYASKRSATPSCSTSGTTRSARSRISRCAFATATSSDPGSTT